VPKQNRFPGFDGLRLLAAVLVMFSHAFLIATGNEEREPLVRLLGPGNILGLYSVFTFFIISGFLLSRSLSSNPSATTYAVNRALRILPGFVFCVIATAFVIGPIGSTMGAREYFRSPPVYEFVRFSVETLDGASLPGVFSYRDSSGLAAVVNGSLWSLRYEALSYVFLLLVWALVPSSGLLAGVMGATALVAWLYPSASFLTSIAYTLPYFAAGVVMHWAYRRHGTRPAGALLALVLLLAASLLGIQLYAFAPLGAYLIVFIGERPNPGSWLATKIGDCSYGLYLYGWPAEQIVKQVTQTTDPMSLFALALPLAFGCALVSYHVVEAPAMRLRKTAASSLKRLVLRLLDLSGGARPVAVLAARGTFAVAAALILARGEWWLFVASMVKILLWTMLGSTVAVSAYHSVRLFRAGGTAVRG
jgi:peptidoglycan/LPS O-acetylase OafA/YrhL